MGSCPDRIPSPLIVTQGRVQYTNETGRVLRGTVTPQGELMMQRVEEVRGENPFEMNITGSIDPRSGAAQARQRSKSCSYDFVWQKAGP